VWVDREDCKGFVENIQTAFNTKMPPKSSLVGDLPKAMEIASKSWPKGNADLSTSTNTCNILLRVFIVAERNLF
jgi:hypothetical protein